MSNRLKLLRDKAVRPRRTVPVLLDGEVREQIEAVHDTLDRIESAKGGHRSLASKSPEAQRRKLEAELEHLYESATDSTLYLVLEAMQRTPYRALVAEHPPRVDGDGKMRVVDRLAGGVNADTFVLPLIRACVIGYRERPEADAEILPLDPSRWNGDEFEPGMVDFLLGYKVTHPDRPELVAERDGFATPWQIHQLGQAATDLCVGDDAVPLPRRQSETSTSDAG